MDNFERKFGKYAVKNLTLILIMCYAVGYVVQMISSEMISMLYLNPAMIIHKGQIWRLISWVVIPPTSSGSIFLTLIMLYFYYSLGTSLEYVWGDFKYNVYIFSGLLFTVAGAFVLYLITVLTGTEFVWLMVPQYASIFSTIYVNMSIFLAYACTFPDNQILFMFIIPIKIKYLGWVYGGSLVLQIIMSLISGYYADIIVIVASLFNFLLFFVTQRKGIMQSKLRKTAFESQYKRGQATRMRASGGVNRSRSVNNSNKDAEPKPKVSRHKCAVCGQTELTAPELSFRFCSKCDGAYEYCERHIFRHKHVENR